MELNASDRGDDNLVRISSVSKMRGLITRKLAKKVVDFASFDVLRKPSNE